MKSLSNDVPPHLPHINILVSPFFTSYHLRSPTPKMTSIQSSFTELSLLPSSPVLLQYGIGDPETALAQYEAANSESDAPPKKPDIHMPSTPLAVWVIRRIGLATLVAKTKETLIKKDETNFTAIVDWLNQCGRNEDTVPRAANWIKETVQQVVANALKDGESGMDSAKATAMAQRVAAIVAGLLAPHFFNKKEV